MKRDRTCDTCLGSGRTHYAYCKAGKATSAFPQHGWCTDTACKPRKCYTCSGGGWVRREVKL